MTHLKLEESERLAALLTAFWVGLMIGLSFFIFGCRVTPTSHYDFTCQNGHLLNYHAKFNPEHPPNDFEFVKEMERECQDGSHTPAPGEH